MNGRGAGLAGCALGYAIGSLPFGVWMGRITSGIDVRDHGSGSMGTTNVLRLAGPVAGAAVFALDVAKGTVAVMAAGALGADPGGQAAAGVAAVVGHAWPALAHFRGGKSVATALGGLLLVSRPGAVAAVVGGGAALAVTRRMSAGSLVAASSATAAAAVGWARDGDAAPFGFAAGVTAVIFYRHVPNLKRMIEGTEPTVTFRRTRPALVPPA